LQHSANERECIDWVVRFFLFHQTLDLQVESTFLNRQSKATCESFV
jgi:hypothetical protein